MYHSLLTIPLRSEHEKFIPGLCQDNGPSSQQTERLIMNVTNQHDIVRRWTEEDVQLVSTYALDDSTLRHGTKKAILWWNAAGRRCWRVWVKYGLRYLPYYLEFADDTTTIYSLQQYKLLLRNICIVRWYDTCTCWWCCRIILQQYRHAIYQSRVVSVEGTKSAALLVSMYCCIYKCIDTAVLHVHWEM